jgi:hypothetical protein
MNSAIHTPFESSLACERPREVAVLLSEMGHDYAIADELMRAGYVVSVCSNTQELTSLLRNGKRPVIVSDSANASSFTPYTQQMGLTHIVYSRVESGISAAALRARVDVHGAPGLDIDAIVTTMRRHLYVDAPPPKPVQPDPVWRLVHRPRRLIDPDNRSIPLTLTEWQFLSHLFSAPNRVLHHTHWQNVSARGTQRDLHNVVVLVSRLRRKAQNASMNLPLVAVRGAGYAFTQACAPVAAS